MVPAESVIKALSIPSILPFSSIKPAAFETPIKVPKLSKSSTIVKVKITEKRP